ncbi:MAG: hypothetical protein FWF88_12020 [Peptococcaceae bacterium]|nr:hypothetical protein [Peptococcaceae bacterium]
MAAIALHYNDLAKAASNADAIAKSADKYANELSKKVIGKFSALSGGSSTYTHNADYYVTRKIAALGRKSQSFHTLSSQLTTLKTTAQRVDQDVQRTMRGSKETFLGSHSNLRASAWKEAMINWLIDLKNSNRLFQFLGDCLAVQMQVWADWRAAYLNWYHCGGGKEIIKIVGAVLVVIAAIAILVMSFPVSGFFALIAVIGAAMFLIDSLVKLYHTGVGYSKYKEGDPAWAKVYGKVDGVSDAIRIHNFGSGGANKYWGSVSKIWTGGQLICGVVGGARFVGNLKPLSNLLSTRAGVGSHLVSSRTFIAGGKDGIRIKNTFTSQSVWNGFKTIAGDKGVRSTLAANFVKDFKVFKPTSINPLQYMKQISNISKPGLALFGDAKTTSQSIAGIAKVSISAAHKAYHKKFDVSILSGT